MLFKCKYCKGLFEQVGNCPNCGGADPEIIVEPSRVETHYVYIPQREFYSPRFSSTPIDATRSWWLGIFGYRVGKALFITLLAAFLIWNIYEAFFTRSTAPSGSLTIPTLMPTKAMAAPTQGYSGLEFMSAEEAMQLQSQENVVNVAVLGAGYGVRYIADTAVILDEATWKRVDQVLGITGISQGETTVTIKSDTTSYTLNQYQGFTLAAWPGKIFIVDVNGSVWEHQYSPELFASVNEAQAALPLNLPPNDNLSPTMK